MSDETITPEQEANNAPETTANNEPETVVETTVADLHQDEPVKKAEKPNTVPFKKFLKEKEKRKELERQLAELQSVGADDDTDDDSDEPEDSEVKKLAEKLERIEGESKKEKLDRIFADNLAKTLENAPEYKDVVNVDVIKALAFNPANSNKTYKQLLEEAYGNAITGRRTIETTTPRGGAKDTKVDMKRAQTDTAYRHEVLADPDLRKQYNEGLTDRVFR